MKRLCFIESTAIAAVGVRVTLVVSAPVDAVFFAVLPANAVSTPIRDALFLQLLREREPLPRSRA